MRPATNSTTTSASARQPRSPRGGKPAQDHPDEGVIAPPIGDRAADERQDRQRQPRDLVGPQEGMLEIDARGDIGQHQHEFAQQRGNDHAFSGEIDEPKRRDLRPQQLPPRRKQRSALPRIRQHDLHGADAHHAATQRGSKQPKRRSCFSSSQLARLLLRPRPLTLACTLSALLVEKLRIDALRGGDVAEKPFEMGFHRDPARLPDRGPRSRPGSPHALRSPARSVPVAAASAGDSGRHGPSPAGSASRFRDVRRHRRWLA